MEVDQETNSISLSDRFCYQIDVVALNNETNFAAIRDQVIEKHQFFLLTEISLAELTDQQFIDSFIKNGRMYMNTHNTRLDCEDCVAVLPCGHVVLSVGQSTNERLPIEVRRETKKSAGFKKYELCLSLNDLAKNKKLDLLKSALKPFVFTFMACWTPNDQTANVKQKLSQHFGAQRVIDCLNRIDFNTVDIDSTALRVLNTIPLSDEIDNWFDIDTYIGCILNNIKPELFSSSFDSRHLFSQDGSNKSKLSYLRVKGFMSNKLAESIVNEYLNNEESRSDRVFIRLHGFIDSPLSLVDWDICPGVAREHVANFLSICIDNKPTSQQLTCLFSDLNKIYIIR